ncbi:Saccharopine dehydrogenase-domain-containing protein [Ochromonadaceae sp. CCMP2298]|nr:Saccharopine dehydrogenase-domain-containing protein [Ochromonadaceae sp. CCMP2298]|mmetsp:Transcript_12156/g.26719  ORF Transcript_12156/g.26719 Transcript_12156/m.26719 type:complete len:522 (+) Transcript_12156:35-1600(+)
MGPSEPLVERGDEQQSTYSSMQASRSDPQLSEQMLKDNKKLPLSDTASATAQFLLFLVVLTPLWLFVLLPFTLVVQLFLYVAGLVTGKPSKSGKASKGTADAVDGEEDPASMQPVATSANTDERMYDIVVFGATGFTGKMAVMYLASRYGSTVRWAIAGRRKDALMQVRAEAAAINGDLANLPIIIADSSDGASLDAMARQAVCVITTAGPFDKYGSKLVGSCARHGTHYCDITGETDWVRKMVDQFDELAKKSGARVVNFCGHDCVPWDLVVSSLSQALKKKGESLVEVSFYDEINSAPSGGTMDTVFHSLGNRVKYISKLGFDPLLKSALGSQSSNRLVSKTQSVLGWSKEYKAWVGPFVMAMVMANCVRRSNALNNYSSRLVYREAAVYPSFMAGYVNVMGLVLLGTMLFCPPLAWVMRKTVLPAPGQGPSKEDMDAGFLRVTGFGTGSNGGKVRAVIYFPTDPGYRDTARMLVESGLVLALEGDKVRVGGGVWTPAACQGDVLMQRLLATGCSLVVE